jgi:hypothetical protein
MTAVDVEGNAFDLSKLVRYEAGRRRVLDALIPEHQKSYAHVLTFTGSTYTGSHCE